MSNEKNKSETFDKMKGKRKCQAESCVGDGKREMTSRIYSLYSITYRNLKRKIKLILVFTFSESKELIFYGTVCRDGKGGLIPVKSRCKCLNPDRDCTENTRLCSAMSTKSEIVKVIPEKRLTPRFNRNPSV